MEGEIDGADYSLKRADLQDRRAGLRAQLDTIARDGHEIVDLAIKALEISQTLENRWISADYQAKWTFLSVMLESVRLNCENLELSSRKPVDLLRDEKLVPLSGASGTPVELGAALLTGFKENLPVSTYV